MLRRSKRLVAETPLKRFKPLRTTKEKRIGRRDTGPDRSTRELVLERDGGCVVCGAYRVQVHHRKPRKAGGRADRRTANSPANLISLCPRDHEWVESARAQAYEAGWLVHEHDDPADIPVDHRAYSAFGLVYLTQDGTVTPVPHIDGGEVA